MTTAGEIQFVEIRRIVPGARAKVFECLTSEAPLREWFAERVQVEARVSGAYRFWGRHTPLTPTEADATQRITRLEPGRVLRYMWEWGGSPCEVLIELGDPDGGVAVTGPATSLWLRHALVEGTVAGFSRTESRFFVEDFWGVALGNLGSYLRTGRAALRPDFTRPDGGGGSHARVWIEIEAPIERVWRALTDPKEMDRWLSSAAVADVRPGGAYSYGWVFDAKACGPTRILEVDPPRRLVHDWRYEADSPTRTEWTLEALSSSRTRVTITQIGISKDRDHTGYTGGWAKFALALKELLEA